MNTDEQIKIVLEAIDNNSFDEQTVLPQFSRDNLKKIVLICEEEKFISHRSSKGQLLVQDYKGGFFVKPTTFVTRSGKQFLEGFDRNASQPAQTFNIESVYNSALGNYNTVNNYSKTPIDDLVNYINSLEDNDEKEQGEELVQTIKNEKIKPGYLAKFDNFLKKHPKTVDLVSSFVTSLVISQI